MSMLYVFGKGFIIGLSVAALIGPIAMLCIKKSLDHGFLSGFSIGLGAATADGVYGSIAAFGLMTIANFMTSHSVILKLAGGLFLIYLGVKAILMALKDGHIKSAKISKGGSLFKDFVSTFLLTLTNPATTVIFMSIFAGLGITGYDETYMSVLMVLGFFLGSLLFYFVLSYTISLIGHKLSDKAIHRISIASGLIISGFGVFSLSSLII